MDTPETLAPVPWAKMQAWSTVGIFWILLLAVMTIAQGLIVPVVSAIFIALIFSPVRRMLGRIGIPAPVAAALILVGVASFLALITYFAADAAFARLDQAPVFFERVAGKVEALFGSLQPVIEAKDQIDAMAQDGSVETVTLREPGFVAGLQEATPIIIGQVVIALTLALFLIASGDMFHEKLVQAMPTLKDKRRALAIARDIENQLSDYLLTITLINAGTGAVIGIAMWALGMPDPLLFAVAAFVLNFIPYLGGLVGVVGTFLIALITLDSPVAAVGPPLAYYLINTLEGQFVTPVLVGRRLKLNAVVVFLAFALWAWLWSFMGMLLAMPILLSLKVVSDQVPGMAPLGKFLADRDELSRADQRIIAFVFRKRRPPVVPAPALPETPVPDTAGRAEQGD